MTELLVPVATLVAELSTLNVVYVRPDNGSAVEFGETYRWGETQSDMWLSDSEKLDMGVVLIRDAAYGDYNMTNTYTRANFEALPAAYPDTFLQMGLGPYDGVTLALPLNAMIPESLAQALRGLEDYPVYDEDVVVRIQMDIEDECWENATKYDLIYELGAYFNNTKGLPFSWDAVSGTWDEMDQFVTFRDALDFTGNYPEFETASSCCYPNLEEVAAEVAIRIMSAHNRMLLESFV